MKRIVVLAILLLLLGLALSCGGSGAQTGVGEDTPTGAYKRLYAAVKSKNTESIKKAITKKTYDFGVMAAGRSNTPIEKMLENGFTATTFSETLPVIRDERVNENMGAIEVWNSKDSIWEDLPFMKEDGEWKLAVGELFANTYKSPGKGRDQLEKIAANALAEGNANTPGANANANANTQVTGKMPMVKSLGPPKPPMAANAK